METYSIGIDSGSVATKAVLFDGEKIVKKVVVPTGWSPKKTSKKAYEVLIDGIDSSKIKKVIGTGYGRVSMDFVDKTVTEITCHTKGIFFLNKNIRTILDIGGQDSKVINIDDKGNVVNFIMNDKCAAGTGKFLEVTSNKLGSDIENIDDLAKDATPENISSMCTVFAESEIVSLLAQDIPKENIAAGILKSIANKGVSILNKARLEDTIAFTGGLAQSKELVKMLENNLNKEIFIAEDAQIIGALGAAIIGFK
ncbi:MAG TPA: 2-hydroxyglutaryl-CoA dehydratase [Terrisporobacter glycolicus]|nr:MULTISPECIES: acyl-CoA dehydratase activase [Terrisporobacter]HBI91340.1 2-hydroxyglutaryl-CoA dehydratase [Terrisporobacter hibernicus]